MGAKYTDSQKEASIKYLSEKTESIQIRVKKGNKSKYKEYAQSINKSLNALIVELLEEDMRKSGKAE